jgi:SMC interacting uncharacterized protein involved in chromosome segregation
VTRASANPGYPDGPSHRRRLADDTIASWIYVMLCKEAQPAPEDSMQRTRARLDRTQIAIETVEREIRTLREHQDACQRGMALDSASLSFYREMISLQEELLTDWRMLSTQLERAIS